MKELFGLFAAFARVGTLMFGGGYAMLPLLQREIVDHNGWATEDELLDYYAIGQCTPGIIAVNTATFVGHKTRGVAGAAAATLGVVFPSVVMIVIIAAVLQQFADIPAVQNAFAGIRVCVCVLIANAVVRLLKKAVIDAATGCIFFAVLIAAVLTDISPAVFVLLAALTGIAVQALRGGRQ